MNRLCSPAVVACVLFVGVVGSACSGAKETGADQAERRSRREPERRPSYVAMNLASTDPVIRTVQLYRGSDETALPVAPLGEPGSLTLEFDLMASESRPLSVYFYHADRNWRRDLNPAEYLSSFLRDDLLDYRISLGTEVPYVHYTYRFPNNTIDFRLSGNYILRVTEQGDEEAVLFERAFFLTEDATTLEFTTDNVLLGGTAYPSTQPIAAFRPPAGLQGNVFDYNVCFVRNGRFEMARCTDRPSLAAQPVMQFYLEPEMAFEPEGASYFLDLSVVDVGPQVARVDRSTTPFQVELEPDYARFGTSGIGPLLNGQTRVSGAVRGVGEADTEAEYVLVRFSYVPPEERQLTGEVIVTGSFSDWQFDPANRLTWVPESNRYEGEVLLKQGQYEYRYAARDRRLERALIGTMPRAENHYAAFVYYRDVSLSTDRLIAVEHILAP